MNLLGISPLVLTTFILEALFFHGKIISAYNCTTEKFTFHSGVIRSPEYPNEYPHNAACHYAIEGKEGDIIEIAFTTFHTERPCKGNMKDYLKITDGKNSDNVQMLYLTGALNMPYHFKSQTNAVNLAFVSDSSVSYSGFEAEFLVHGSNRKYPTKRLSDLSGEIMSPGYPKFHYPNGIICDYVLRAKKGYYIEITFDVFEMESQNYDKRTDYLRIHGGKVSAKDKTMYYLNGTMQTPFSFIGKSSRIILRFVTNSKTRMRGFHAFYKQIREPVYCTRLSVLYGSSNCTAVGNKGLYSKCQVKCNAHYLLLGNGTTHCNNGIFADSPECIPDLKFAEICAKNISDPECPFLPETVAEFYSEYAIPKPLDRETDEMFSSLFEDVGNVLQTLESTPQEQSILPIGRSPVKKWKCPAYLCEYNSVKRKFRYNCKYLAMKLQKRYKLNHKQTKSRMIQCFTCQSHNCGATSVIFS